MLRSVFTVQILTNKNKRIIPGLRCPVYFAIPRFSTKKVYEYYNSQSSMSTKALPSTERALLQADPTSTTITLVERPLPTPNFGKGKHLIQVHSASPCVGELLWPQFGDISGKEIITCDDVTGVVVRALLVGFDHNCRRTHFKTAAYTPS